MASGLGDDTIALDPEIDTTVGAADARLDNVASLQFDAASAPPYDPRMKRKDPLRRVEIDPKVMLGKPVIRGTRISVEAILEKLAADIPIAEILEDYPRLTRADVLAAIAYARQAVGTDEIIPRAAASRR